MAETVRERFDLKRLIQTLTMQGRMSRWIVIGAADLRGHLVVRLENPHYFHPLTSTLGGQDRPHPGRRLGRRGVVRHQENRRDRGLRCCRDHLPAHRPGTARNGCCC